MRCNERTRCKHSSSVTCRISYIIIVLKTLCSLLQLQCHDTMSYQIEFLQKKNVLTLLVAETQILLLGSMGSVVRSNSCKEQIEVVFKVIQYCIVWYFAGSKSYLC